MEVYNMTRDTLETYKDLLVPIPVHDAVGRSKCEISTKVDCFLLIACEECIYRDSRKALEYFMYKGYIDKAKALDMSLLNVRHEIAMFIKDIDLNQGKTEN